MFEASTATGAEGLVGATIQGNENPRPEADTLSFQFHARTAQPRLDAPGFRAAADWLAGVKTAVTRYPLAAANDALSDLRTGRLQGAAVLTP